MEVVIPWAQVKDRILIWWEKGWRSRVFTCSAEDWLTGIMEEW